MMDAKKKWPQRIARIIASSETVPYYIGAAAFVIGLPCFYLVDLDPKTFSQLRGSLFTGFFTVSGFMLSTKTWIILNMKKEVYENKSYLDHIHEQDWANADYAKRLAGASRSECHTSKVYLPLQQIGTLLTVNIILALITSFSQITIGLWESRILIGLCLALAIATAFMLACSVALVWLNFQSLYRNWEKLAQLELDTRWQKSSEALKQNRVEPVIEALPTIATVGPSDPLTKR